MRIKPIDIKIVTEDEAREYLNKIFVGSAAIGHTTERRCYCKPSRKSMQVITYHIDPGIIQFSVATLREHRNTDDYGDVSYRLDDTDVKIEYTIPTCVLDLLTGIKELITPIFEQVARASVDAAMKSYLKLAEPKIEW